ncbi:MAG: hypothetical protein RRB13_07110 [bacterium]|nr:hypothetical protein [bacterium]
MTWTQFSDQPNLGLNSPHSRPFSRPHLLSFQGHLLATWTEQPEGQAQGVVRVARLEGDQWNFVDGGAGLSTNDCASLLGPRLVAVGEDRLLVSFLECERGAVLGRLLEWDLERDWSEADEGGLNLDPDQAARSLSFCSDGVGLYGTWIERSSLGWRVRVVHTGLDGHWSWLDGGGLEGLNAQVEGDAQHPSIAFYGGQLHLFWVERRGSLRLFGKVFTPPGGWKDHALEPAPFELDHPQETGDHLAPQLVATRLGLVLAYGHQTGRVCRWEALRLSPGGFWHREPYAALPQRLGFPAAVTAWGEGYALAHGIHALQLTSQGGRSAPARLLPAPGVILNPESQLTHRALAAHQGRLYALWIESTTDAHQNQAARLCGGWVGD